MQHLHSKDNLDTYVAWFSETLSDFYAQPRNRQVTQHLDKEELVSRIIQENPPEQGIGFDSMKMLLKDTIMAYGVKTWHPHFFNQMSAGTPAPAVVSSAIASMINSTLSTYEAAPTATIVERNVAQWMAQLLGMPEGSGGIFLPGGSLSNLLALTLARKRKFYDKTQQQSVYAVANAQPAILCSKHSHYSVSNAAMVLGIMPQNIIAVKTNHRGEMDPKDLATQLKNAVKNGLLPFAVVANLGVSVTGGFDPLSEIVAVCKPYDIHIHGDAAFGGGMALTDQRDILFKGIEHVDTVTWDAHKCLYMPLTSSVLLTPHLGALRQCFSSGADYLFREEIEDDPCMARDLGSETLLCGKRFEALPLWMFFNTYGVSAMREMVQSRLELAREFASYLDQVPEFELPFNPVSPLLNFRYLPAHVENASPERQDEYQRWVREKLRVKGQALFNIATLNDRKYLRMILINPLTTMDDLKNIANQIIDAGQELEAKVSSPTLMSSHQSR